MGMRRGRENGWMDNDNGQMMAVNLGSDFTAEHEWGIMDLYQTLGINYDESVMGIERYRVKKPQMEGVWLAEQSKNDAALIVMKPYEMKWLKERLVGKKLNLDEVGGRNELMIYKEDELATAWSGSELGIRVKRPTNIKKLKQIHKAIENKEAAVWLGGAGVFKNAGLVIGIIGLIPENKKQEMLNAHLDQDKLDKAAAAVGIKERIDALNKDFMEKNKGCYETPFGYYSLRAGWLTKGRESKYPVMYWLSPRQYNNYESGWYTVEELEQWLEGTGPVFKKVKEQIKAEVAEIGSLADVAKVLRNNK